MRLIDADAMKTKFISWLPKDPQEGGTEVENIAVSAIMEIDDAPTVDAVPVDWINVDDRLPVKNDADRSGYVVVLREDDETDFCRWNEVLKGCVSGRKYTHWIALPTPPGAKMENVEGERENA